ncbi:hypothetical protein HWV62_33485 [Athelia sp. TMB]|nr:hypothetical protein HWV62_33485 [Athelia sp. TMB]
MALSPLPALTPEAVEPAAPKRKPAVLEAELAKAQPGSKGWIFASPSSASGGSSSALEDAGQSPRKRGRKTQSAATRSNIGTIKVTPRVIAFVAVQVGLIDFSSA